jgi:hypothetical protein
LTPRLNPPKLIGSIQVSPGCCVMFWRFGRPQVVYR